MDEENIGFYFALSWAVIFVLAVCMLLFHFYYRAYLHKREQQKQIESFAAVVNAEERQKEAIANMIHDEVIHLLAVAAQHVYLNKPESREKTLSLVQQSISSLKSISIDLVPKTLMMFGLIRALAQHTRLINTDNGREIEFINDSIYSTEIPLPKSSEVMAYRICLEILNNLLKHSNFTYLRISATNTDNDLHIDFDHNGKGVTNQEIADMRDKSQGLGLKSLQSRLAILGATMDYSAGAELSSVKLTIPLEISGR